MVSRELARQERAHSQFHAALPAISPISRALARHCGMQKLRWPRRWPTKLRTSMPTPVRGQNHPPRAVFPAKLPKALPQAAVPQLPKSRVIHLSVQPGMGTTCASLAIIFSPRMVAVSVRSAGSATISIASQQSVIYRGFIAIVAVSWYRWFDKVMPGLRRRLLPKQSLSRTCAKVHVLVHT